ncbi:MAG: alpha/beta fold hydrolase [Kofleriaceae bacterium]
MARSRALLVHSGGFTSRQWRKLAAQLAPDHEVLAPDLIGYGAAGPWPVGEPFHFAQDVARLASLIEDEPAHLVGHSYGGLLVLQLALAHPERVRSIAVYEPVAFGVLDDRDADARAVLDRVRAVYAPDADGVDEAWLASFVDWWNGPGAWARLGPETQASFRAVGWKLSQEVASLMADTTRAAGYARIAAPTLLLGGELTPLPERRTLERLAAALPDARLALFPGLGHMGPITHAAQINAAIAAHLAQSGVISATNSS